MADDDGNEMDLKQMEQEELKEDTNLDITQTFVNDAEEQGDLTIREGLEDEIPEAAAVGFDDIGGLD